MHCRRHIFALQSKDYHAMLFLHYLKINDAFLLIFSTLKSHAAFQFQINDVMLSFL